METKDRYSELLAFSQKNQFPNVAEMIWKVGKDNFKEQFENDCKFVAVRLNNQYSKVRNLDFVKQTFKAYFEHFGYLQFKRIGRKILLEYALTDEKSDVTELINDYEIIENPSIEIIEKLQK